VVREAIMKRLLKREVGIVPTLVLSMRYCRILERAEKLAAKDIPVADAREILWVEDELQRRLIAVIGHNFYPPDNVEAKPTIKSLGGGKMGMKLAPQPEEKKPLRRHISHERTIAHALAPRAPQGKPKKDPLQPIKPKTGRKLKFNIEVNTSLGSKAAEFSVDADTKLEADKLANKQIRKLGLKGATYKIR